MRYTRNPIEENNYKRRAVKWIYNIVPFVLLFLSWEILARLISTSDFPTFSTIVANAFSASLAYHLGTTLIFSFLGLTVISIVGLPLGKLIQRSEKIKWTLNPFLWFLVFAIVIGYKIMEARLIVLFGLSQLTIFIQSILLPILIVALISGYGHRMIAIRIGFLLCLTLRIIGEMIFGVTTIGIGHQLSLHYHLHNTLMVYSIILLIGFAGLLIEEIIPKHAGNIIVDKLEKRLKPKLS